MLVVIYRKPLSNLSPGLIFVHKHFLWAYTWEGLYMGEGAYIWMTLDVSNNIYCTCKLYRQGFIQAPTDLRWTEVKTQSWIEFLNWIFPPTKRKKQEKNHIIFGGLLYMLSVAVIVTVTLSMKRMLNCWSNRNIRKPLSTLNSHLHVGNTGTPMYGQWTTMLAFCLALQIEILQSQVSLRL